MIPSQLANKSCCGFLGFLIIARYMIHLRRKLTCMLNFITWVSDTSIANRIRISWGTVTSNISYIEF